MPVGYEHLMGQEQDVKYHPDYNVDAAMSASGSDFLNMRGYTPSRKDGDALDYDAKQSTQWRTQQEAKGNPKKI